MPPKSLHAKVDEVLAVLARLESTVAGLIHLSARNGDDLMANIKDLETSFDDLEAKVTAEETVEASAIALLNGINARLEAALNGAVNFDDLRSRVDVLKQKIAADTVSLAGSVTANTPAAAPPDAPPAAPSPPDAPPAPPAPAAPPATSGL